MGQVRLATLFIVKGHEKTVSETGVMFFRAIVDSPFKGTNRIDLPWQCRKCFFDLFDVRLGRVVFELKKHRVVATTDVENTASYRLLETLGFRREGHFIQNIFFKGAWGDEYQYALLRSEGKFT